MLTKFSIAIAGTTEHTVMCAEALRRDDRFEIPWVLTPVPKPVGRKQILSKNPLHQWAEYHHIPIIHVEKKINDSIESKVKSVKSNIDFLLVVDFGYLVPKWLLDLPLIAPLNIHPSDLPKYRGSSPGQFALLFGEKDSAVTLMKMDIGLDTGDILTKLPFSIENDWTTTEYYQHAFELISAQLPQLVADLAAGEISPQSQPTESPTPIAGRLSKQDSFIDWSLLSSFLSPHGRPARPDKREAGGDIKRNEVEPDSEGTSDLLKLMYSITNQSWPQTIAQAIRGLSPWPGVWTIVPTQKGDKRMKILEVSITDNKIILEKVQLEGLQPTTFDQIKNQIV